MTDNHEIATLLQKEHYGFDDLSAIMRILRSEGGCPWDREQTHASIRNDLIEETYEVVEAIDNEDPALLREELGDLLFQIFFHAQIEAEENRGQSSGNHPATEKQIAFLNRLYAGNDEVLAAVNSGRLTIEQAKTMIDKKMSEGRHE